MHCTQIVRQRIYPQAARDGRAWNSFPGGLMVLPDHVDSPGRLPWNKRRHPTPLPRSLSDPLPKPPLVAPPPPVSVENNSSKSFTAVIYAQQQQISPLVPSASSSSGPLVHLLRVVAKSRHVARVRAPIER